MKFEEKSLDNYLVKNLKPLTKADPVILAKYVAALLKKEEPVKELRNVCAESLVEFLGQSTESFITKLFKALDDGSIITLPESLDAIEQVDISQSLAAEDPKRLIASSSKPGCSPSGHRSEQEKKEASDDDDNRNHKHRRRKTHSESFDKDVRNHKHRRRDTHSESYDKDVRNHKHRRRETHSESFDKDVQGKYVSRPDKKRNKSFGDEQVFLDRDPQLSENRKDYNRAASERNLSTKFDTKHPSLAPFPRDPVDSERSTRVNQAFQGEPGRIPLSKGRGRIPGPWSQDDSKFSSFGSHDFALQMASRGNAPGLFAGRGTQRFFPGMPNGSMDALHPHCSQGTLGPPINQSLGIGIPRQRCKDYEERGFCLRGDMCPMEHGVNRIVVEDVQSLLQFNLPVSLPSANLLGVPARTGPWASAPPNLPTHAKSLHGTSSKPGMTENGVGSSASGADLYDPDEPFWNNHHPETSNALIGPAAPNVEDATPLGETDNSGCRICMTSNGIDSECFCRSIGSAVGPQSKHSSVWGRIEYPGNILDMTGKLGGSITAEGSPRNETEEHQDTLSTLTTYDAASKAKLQNDPARKNGRRPKNAFRTLYLTGIPLEKNKIEPLLSHFRKFGVVVDIYIPRNCETAFVQFSNREEAEAALKAPDAVMGNRFIQLSWATHDRIIGNGVISSDTHVLPQSSVADIEKDLPSVSQKVNIAPALNIYKPAAGCPKGVVVNCLKAESSSQKKLESLEVLKEELRLKQEMLNKKRNDFLRQLDRLEKQAATVKGEAAAEQAVKKYKEGITFEAATPTSTNPVNSGYKQEDKRTMDETNPRSPSAKTKSSTVLQSPMSLKHPSCSPASLGTPFLAKRHKLDNFPTTFKVLPPLPADFANVVVLKEHFSAFGDLSEVELESSEAHVDPACPKPSETCCACITFTSRQAAEGAFFNGKCWQGHNLQFSWLTTSSNFIDDHHGGRENSPMPSLKGLSDAEALAENVAPGLSLSSSSMRSSICSVSQAMTSTSNREANDTEEGGLQPMGKVENFASSHVTKSLFKSLSPKADTLIADDDLIINFVQ